jgi:hypothetical protein
VAGHSPEDERERSDEGSYENGHPDRTAQQELLDVRFANAQRAEWCRLRLSKKDEDGVELVLM